MRLASNLRDRYVPERYQSLVTELFKFAAVGGVNTVIDYTVLNLLLSIGPLKAKIVAAVVATTASYVLNRQWTFQSRDRSTVRREYTLFFALNGVGLLIQGAVLAVAKYGLDFSEHNSDDRLAFNIANAVGIAVAMVFRFWAYRTFVFRPTPATPEEELEAEVEALEAALTDVAVAPSPRHAEEDDLEDAAARR
ncbi:GtrA family protein [Dactylosporangium sp. AC04546]|uniref:GtrA family protein n=1 Tax=Dactylosporangium sp. AC04546 TaxID=2862460 RepID=UPI001EDDEF42|nr:GtrA family protein [Dactylosporangium sp. AC04546]WVK84799.1 GtrA family protein [Dactylosporangium sp. AC04546]